MPMSRHFQMGAIPMEKWILVNFLYRFNMLLTHIPHTTCISNKTSHLRHQAIGTSAKGHGTKIFLQLFFHIFLAEFGKAYIISIEIRHGM